MFGHIKQICKHLFNSKQHTLVVVHWFDGYTAHLGSGLQYVNVKSQDLSLYSVVSVYDLSRPSIRATKGNNLWNLNCEI